MTLWVSSEAIAAWTPRRSGGQRRYSDLAIETALTLRLLYHLPLRQAEGFLHALFGIMRLDLSVPDDTTLSRRSQHLRRCLRPVPPGEGLHLVLDSMGLSIVGAGEWAAATHGGRGRRGWRKLHRGVDQSGVIRVHTLTEATGDDASPHSYHVNDCKYISNMDTVVCVPLITTAIVMWNSSDVNWDVKSSTRSSLGCRRSSLIVWSRLLDLDVLLLAAERRLRARPFQSNVARVIRAQRALAVGFAVEDDGLLA